MCPLSSSAQKGKVGRAADQPIYFVADNLIHDQFEMPDAQRLSGHVVFRHAGMTMWCDSAVYFQATKSFEAFGNVKVTQGDTLSMKGDRLLYDGMTQTSFIRSRKGTVEVRHHHRYLYSDSLFYDAANNYITYNTGGKLVDRDNVLTSDYGEYYTDSRQAIFRSKVNLTSSKDRLVTEELHYNTRTGESVVVGGSNIFSGDYNIYTTNGKYTTNSEVVQLFERSIMNNPSRQLHVEADKVFYDKQKGYMRATGNIICVDSKTKAILTGEECEFYEDKEARKDSSFVTGKALVQDFSNGKDTLYVHADTLKMFSYNVKTDSLYRELKGYHHARAWRSDVQAVADSLIYNTRARELSLHRDPIVWTDNRQLLGESIQVYMNDSVVDSVYVREQTLMVERLDSVHYNQIAGKLMRAYFVKGDIRQAFVDGNVSMVMFITEKDSTILYHNYTEAPHMRMEMENRRLTYAVAYPAPEGTMYPLGTAPQDKTYLPNFAWFDYIRPLDKDDLFEWRPKKDGLELKSTPRRNSPLQYISK